MNDFQFKTALRLCVERCHDHAVLVISYLHFCPHSTCTSLLLVTYVRRYRVLFQADRHHVKPKQVTMKLKLAI